MTRMVQFLIDWVVMKELPYVLISLVHRCSFSICYRGATQISGPCHDKGIVLFEPPCLLYDK